MTLLDHHAVRENDELFPLLGGFFSDQDDTMLMGILQQIGWSNVGPFVTMVGAMEKALADNASPATPRPAVQQTANRSIKAKQVMAIRSKGRDKAATITTFRRGEIDPRTKR